MGLPRDVVEEVLKFHHEDLGTLKTCSLTCRALFSAVRALIHGRVRLSLGRSYPPYKLVDRIVTRVLRGWKPMEHEVYLRRLSMAEKLGVLGYAREVYIDIGRNFLLETLEACFPHFHSFTQVRTLTIDGFDLKTFLPGFGRYFTQSVPALRSLHLPCVTSDLREVLEFICMFPHLDDLSLILSSYYCVGVPPSLSVERSPPLRGTLVLEGQVSIPARFLLGNPGGLHFRSINASVAGKVDLDRILVACSSDLEMLSLRPRQSSKFIQYHLPSGKVRCRSLNRPLRYPSSGGRGLEPKSGPDQVRDTRGSS